MGQMYFDLSGTIVAKNHRTGDTAELTLHPRGKSGRSSISGFGYDANFNKLYEISGSWLDEIKMKNLRTCFTSTLWSQPEVLEDHQHQYGFSTFATSLNQKTDEMIGVVAPTDSRFRPDQRLLEDGFLDKAETEKQRLEKKQRQAAKQLGLSTHRPQFFDAAEESDGKSNIKVFWPSQKVDYWAK